MTSTAALVDFASPEYVADPYPALARLRTIDPVHRHESGMWLLTRHADVAAVNRDHRFGRDLRKWAGYASLRPYLADSALERSVEKWMFSLDPPAHTRLRRLMSDAFSPRAVAAMRTPVESACDRLMDEMTGESDFMAAFARPFPLRVIATILGLPAADLPSLHAWSSALAVAVEPFPSRAQKQAAASAVTDLEAYLAGHLREAAARPGTLSASLLPLLDAGRIAAGELLANLLLVFVAGHETTTNLLGNGLLALTRHPVQFDLLRADPSLIPGAVEELLRYDGPANFNGRVVHERTVIGDRTIDAGELLMGMLGAANRDPAVFAEPDRLDVTRSPNPHVTFGGGVHFCLGASLARLEAATALQRIVARWRHIEIDESRVAWRPLLNIRGLETLPISVPGKNRHHQGGTE